MKVGATRPRLYECCADRNQIRATVATIVGVNSNLQGILGVTLKTAWSVSHRIHEAMRSGS